MLTLYSTGDSAKQARISQTQYRKYFYYLTGGDERIGEIIRETLDVLDTYLILDRELSSLLGYNNANIFIQPHEKSEQTASSPTLQLYQSVSEPISQVSPPHGFSSGSAGVHAGRKLATD